VKLLLKSAPCALALILFSQNASYAHQPVFLNKNTKNVTASPVLVEGTISFAVTANLSRAGDKRHVRFALNDGERLRIEYLILDRAPDNQLPMRELPSVRITSPSGKVFRMSISERTSFFEPFGGQNYFFLSRIDQAGEPGIYSLRVSARARSTAIIAVGTREIRGEVMDIGSTDQTCPKKLASEMEISNSRAVQLIGLSERAGELCAMLNKWNYRTVKKDGKDFPVTMDYLLNRVNFVITKGLITQVTVG
jgi:hypothetical protein